MSLYRIEYYRRNPKDSTRWIGPYCINVTAESERDASYKMRLRNIDNHFNCGEVYEYEIDVHYYDDRGPIIKTCFEICKNEFEARMVMKEKLDKIGINNYKLRIKRV